LVDPGLSLQRRGAGRLYGLSRFRSRSPDRDTHTHEYTDADTDGYGYGHASAHGDKYPERNADRDLDSGHFHVYSDGDANGDEYRDRHAYRRSSFTNLDIDTHPDEPRAHSDWNRM
jgi:hypothetical protein